MRIKEQETRLTLQEHDGDDDDDDDDDEKHPITGRPYKNGEHKRDYVLYKKET